MKAEVAFVQALQGERVSKAHAKNSKRDAGCSLLRNHAKSRAGSEGSRRRIRDVRGGSCGRVLSLNTRETRTPTPSNTLKRIPHATAEPRADRGPPDGRN